MQGYQTTLPFQVRNKAYSEIREHLGGRQAQILLEISKHPQGLTNFEIKQNLNLEINQVTGRVRELYDAGYVIANGTKLNDKTGKTNTIYVISASGKILIQE